MDKDSLWTAAAIALSLVLAGCEDKKDGPVSGPVTTAPAATTATATKEEPNANTTAPAAPAKSFDCGAKGQKMCPMQAWMKSEMANASSSGDGDKLAKALAYVAARPPPGYPQWVAFANDGAAKAKKGDVDGAKSSCKQCHDAYKEDYKRTMRDRPF